MLNLSTTYANLKLKTPIIVGSAGITGSIELLQRAEECGAGAVVTKSLFQKEISRKSPTPRFKIVKHTNTFTFYTYEQASELNPQEYAEFIFNAKQKLSIPVIASINCYTDDAWIEYSKLMEEAGADAIELNLSCPHGVHIMSGMNIIEEMVHTTKIVKNNVKIPVIPKMTPQSANPGSDALRLEQAGADGLVMFNRFTGLDIDIEKEIPILHGGYAGHGGPWAIMYGLRWISAVSPKLKCSISASGGVMNGEDAIKYILSGASAVQIVTTVFLNGYEVIKQINKYLEQYLDRKGYRTINDFKGKVCDKILDMESVDRRHWGVASINKDKCIGCGKCFNVCIYDAIKNDKEKFMIKENCDGCGLCIEVCPVNAISMVEKERN
ncbi:4Fe-4S dicluster-binding protein [Thermoanaerobacterium sp. RBIITD]|jgi:dihydroorotate dehydrogenase (subfamily 1) family protein|uniref:4Fe-4S dicluster-binding protein n=1 Tax=Thermoanaerobacterium TaxID=28895 RepID=UPI000BB972E0|nr:4Fe-4S dicluster-binding protein [Thermoanaerobacterium sp. RBIITD]WHE05985.1 4Fe-4S binding protein [Thermoanaerobacterium thermosaccharolyticum]SNX54646.1 dihydroorotate dehydrogenase (fumarate) [Thermoanaerobacterium sp. RBIITD]